ncbi:MAG TPA: hypothetical protein VMZ28_11155, partial [Kofleriaceae bacterium]|nr:hypothetical protein [Kofleriaceae bacterium]
MRRACALGLVVVALVGLAGGAAAGTRRKNTTSRVQKMTPAEVAALRVRWGDAPTGNAFLSETGLKPHDLQALREAHGGFDAGPKGRRAAYDPARVPEMKRAWKKVRSGDWTVKKFIETYLPGRNHLETLRLHYPGDFDPAARTLLYDPKKVPAMRRDWKRVERGEWQVKEFVSRHLDSYEGVLALRRAYPGEFQKIQEKKQTKPRKRLSVADLPPEAVAGATELFAAHQRDELRYSDLLGRLGALGISEGDVRRMKKSDPVTYASREQFREAHFDDIADAILTLAHRYRPSIRNLGDLFEVVNRTDEFVSRYGRVDTDAGQNNWVLIRDRKHGDRLRRALAEEIGLTHRPERVRPKRAPGTRPQMSRSLMWREGNAPDLGAMAGELAERLAREKEPTREVFDRVIRQLTRKNPAFGSERRVRKMMYTYQRQFPELDRWKLEARKHSLRYVARWMESVHRAGPRATYADVVALFRQSPEYAEDPRLPDDLKWSADQVRLVPRGVTIGVRERALYQGTRAWLEGMRTAPRGASMSSVSLADPRRIAYATAKKLIRTLDHAAMRRLALDPALLDRLKAADWTGLGEEPDPSFDHNVEPPELDMRLVHDILDMP